SKCKDPHVAAEEELDMLLNEYAIELQKTTRWKADPQGEREKLFEEWKKEYANDKGEFTLYTHKGCDTCGGIGYKGRMGLHELLMGSDAIKKLIHEPAAVAEMLGG